MRSGFLIIDKPAGFTSHDVVAIARKALLERRVGHAGTLDPFATGVLVLGVGSGTRLLQYITDGKKSYQATIRLGIATTTDDFTGEVLKESLSELSGITDDMITNELKKMIGDIQQLPSTYSAIRINGKRAYEIARAGEEVILKSRAISIFSIEILEIRRAKDGIYVDITVECSAGTYIRAIARDLGESLGVGGHLTTLRRLTVEPFTLSDAITLDQLKQGAHPASIESVVRRLFPMRELTAQEQVHVSHGRSIDLTTDELNTCAAFTSEGRFMALLSPVNGRLQPILVVNQENS